MPTVRLRPGTVTSFAVPPADPVAIVGDPDTVWADDSDATYAIAVSDAGEVPDSPIATISLDSIPASATFSDAVLTYRVSMTGANEDGEFKSQVALRTDPDNIDTTGDYFGTDELVGGSGVQNIEWVLLEAGDPSPFLTMEEFLPNGLTVNFYAVNARFGEPDWDATATIYELWIDVTYTLAGGPPTRLHPTDHRLRNTPRIFPPSRSRHGGHKPTGYR